MAKENNAVRLKRRLISEVTNLALAGKLADEIDSIPYSMTNENWEIIQCCIHHDRANLRLRLLSLLGYSTEGMLDVDKPLRAYAQEALAGKKPDAFPLSLMSAACNGCTKSRYIVTNACQGCLARPCKVNCPKGAVSIINNQSHIDPELCVNCGLCEKSCPFHAIIKIPVPCEEVCPVGAIQKGEDGIAKIDESKCILCGKCLSACPFGAPAEKSEIVQVLSALTHGKKLIALVAPAAMVQFPFPPGKFIAALEHFGFSKVMEVAEAADRVAEAEAREFAERLHDNKKVLATSCCPSWVRAAGGMDLEQILSDTPSPMLVAAKTAKAQDPDAFTVFIGPCLAKRWEAHRASQNSQLVDAVLTSEEVGAMLMAAGIQVNEENEEDLAKAGNASAYGRGFAMTQGVTAAVKHALSPSAVEVNSCIISGITKDTASQLKKVQESDKPLLIEVMACDGGCINGPCQLTNPKVAGAFLERYKAAAKKTAGPMLAANSAANERKACASSSAENHHTTASKSA